ncbi:deoxynucleoside triphosphate triphosphohydrolase samhd1 homolog [Phtheirospermum japonicum]|uniref:Deoxynucleoside triphosphate triphosphohydrolase samhd1 homolog n=1 Tax=Phtheirospermum japonicum TaxID=374723 RepID=A0A830D2P6_9LAMI|nr:deoxynucleoside triphosphate triphosphohydrolase samhd1 homolog [Phtheirospermum japonicum]
MEDEHSGGEEIPSSNIMLPSTDDRRLSKHIHDNVHGNIYLDPVLPFYALLKLRLISKFAGTYAPVLLYVSFICKHNPGFMKLSLKFVDTEQFQRLRDLKQLGEFGNFAFYDFAIQVWQFRILLQMPNEVKFCLSYMVYPGAVHSRFEHSVGVYWLASEAINRLKNYQGLELGIDGFDTQTVKLAGLLHDFGHGPFSHMFEREFLPRVLPDMKWSHEEMSLKMIDYVVDEHSIDIDPNGLKKVKELIIASESGTSRSSNEKLFLYDIVANGRNGIDVDKFDYIVRDSRACGLGINFQFQRVLETMRVIDDEICYRAKEYLTIHKLFATRADLHRTVYMHAKVKGIELMLVDAMTKANDVLHISSYIDEPAQYWKYCNEFSVPKENLEHFKNVTPQDIICSQSSSHPTLHEEDIAVSNVKIDLSRGRNNPLQSISFFKDYDSNEKFTINDARVSHLLPTSYQDMIVRVYSKKPNLVEAVSEAFENFQMKKYGMKTQVHATPEKKKRKL